MTTRFEMENQAIETTRMKATVKIAELLAAIERRLADVVVAIEENTDKR